MHPAPALHAAKAQPTGAGWIHELKHDGHGGPIGALAGIGKMGIGANNLSYVENQRKTLGLEPLSGWQKVGTIAGLNDYGKHGYVGDVGINNKDYGVSAGGGVIGGRTSLTPNEARTRSQIAAGLARQAIEAAGRSSSGGARDTGTGDRTAGGGGRGGNVAGRNTSTADRDREYGGSARDGGGGRSRDGRESDRMGGDRPGGGARGGMGGPR